MVMTPCAVIVSADQEKWWVLRELNSRDKPLTCFMSNVLQTLGEERTQRDLFVSLKIGTPQGFEPHLRVNNPVSLPLFRLTLI